MPIYNIPFKIHTKEEIEKYFEEVKQEVKYLYFFETKKFKYALIYKPHYYTEISHIDFYAMSGTCFNFTNTGYRSNFMGTSDNIFSEKELYDMFNKELDKSGAKTKKKKNQCGYQGCLF
jgi:hypothetical protein